MRCRSHPIAAVVGVAIAILFAAPAFASSANPELVFRKTADLFASWPFRTRELEQLVGSPFARNEMQDRSGYWLGYTSDTGPIRNVTLTYRTSGQRLVSSVEFNQRDLSRSTCLTLAELDRRLSRSGWQRKAATRSYGVFRNSFAKDKYTLHADLSGESGWNGWCVNALTIAPTNLW